jgi:hypothetical protein
MKKKLFLLPLLLFIITSCNNEKEPQTVTQKGDFDVHEPDQSDKSANNGKLRFTLEGKPMHDNYFVAQFTPKGDMFENDNLQLYNYNLGSNKYPQFMLSIDNKESNLKNWEGQTFPLDFLAFTAAENTTPFNSQGKVSITNVTETSIEGTFNGKLIHPISRKSFPIKGEFKAIIRVNV